MSQNLAIESAREGIQSDCEQGLERYGSEGEIQVTELLETQVRLENGPSQRTEGG